tara:strand:+ start:8808 stop:9431 length:624 start_codon:yes stop_codon:yes gene_type:complete
MTKFITLLILITCLSCSQPYKTIQTDGIIEIEEWKDAEGYELNDGNKILILKNGDELNIALISTKKIWSHLYLSDGETTKVMHASAALDAVDYIKTDSLWLTQDDFEYVMRDKFYTPELEEKMKEYYTNNGWVANNVSLGNGKTIEFKIDMKKWKNSLFLSTAMANMDMSIHSFPTSLNDHTILPRLVQGYAKDSLNFEPTTWFKIK